VQDIAPFENWEKYYRAVEDERSPFYGQEYNTQYYENTIYGYYIHPYWDEIESETLYLKVLYTDYDLGFVVIELLGEWNDTLHNDIMFLKRRVIDLMLGEGIKKYILIGEHVLNFHGSVDDDYYAEWAEEVEEGWIVGIGFRDHVLTEWARFHLDYYINFGGTLELDHWRTMAPLVFFDLVNGLMQRRLGS
jgi:hypothetical protein